VKGNGCTKAAGNGKRAEKCGRRKHKHVIKCLNNLI